MRSLDGLILVGGVAVAFLAYRELAKTGNVISHAAGGALSDVSAYLHGWRGVEFTPLVISPRYLNADFTLHDNARVVLSRVEEYQPLLKKLFGNDYRQPMSAAYRSLIGKHLVYQNGQITILTP